jgi:hypothetical protein
MSASGDLPPSLFPPDLVSSTRFFGQEAGLPAIHGPDRFLPNTIGPLLRPLFMHAALCPCHDSLVIDHLKAITPF